jgi:TusA-related sulfurtransferase
MIVGMVLEIIRQDKRPTNTAAEIARREMHVLI